MFSLNHIVSATVAAIAVFLTASYLRTSLPPSPQNITNSIDELSLNMTLSQISRSVIKQVFAAEQKEGMGAVVRRSIGSMNLKNLSPFLMLDHFNLGPGAGFPDHPHRGQATVTYIIEGESMHEDSAGHKGTIRAGGVQYMTAGKGVVHSEIPVHGPGLPNPQGFQLWVDLPAKFKMIDPQYHELDPENIPSAYPEGEDGPVRIKVISGKSFDVESPVKPIGGCWYMHLYFKKQGAKVFQTLPPGWTAFLYTFKGKIYVDREKEDKLRDAFNTLVLSSNSNETGVHLEAAEDDTQAILVAGEPLDQPVFQYGPFVMTTKEEIMDTLRDYQIGRNGFENAKDWQSEIGKEFLEKYGQ